MNTAKYTMDISCDYTDYYITMSLISEFKAIEEAEQFASRYIKGIEITETGCKLVAEDTDIGLVRCKNYLIRKLKDSARDKVIYDAEADYCPLDCDVKHLFSILCLEYGDKQSFFFSASSYSIKKA